MIVSDTMGRPWRNGLTDVALGVAGMPAIRDHRGEVDPYGNELQLPRWRWSTSWPAPAS